MQTTLFKNFYLYVIPTIFSALVIYLTHIQGSYFFLTDPEYAYLLNSLNLLHFNPPTHTDHPGTPLHLLGSLIIGIRFLCEKWFEGSQLSLTASVLSQSEGYLTTMHWTLLTMAFTAIIWVSRRIYALTTNLKATLLFQFALLCFPTIVAASTRVMPEALNLTVTLVLFYHLLPFFLDKPIPEKHERTLGLILGLGIATKLTFVPCLTLIFLFSERRKRIVSFLYTCLSFVVCTFPIINIYPRIYDWSTNLLVRSNPYGVGHKGFPPLAEMWAGFKYFFEVEHFFVLAIVVFLIFIRFFKKGSSENTRPLVLGVRVLLFQILITIKYLNPRYLIAAYVLAACLFTIFYLKANPLLKKVLVTFTICGFLGQIYSLLPAFDYSKVAEFRKTVHEQSEFIEKNPCYLISFHYSPNEADSLAFGNVWSGNHYLDELEVSFPNFLTYDYATQKFKAFRGVVPEDVVRNKLSSQKCVYLKGSSIDYKVHNAKFSDLDLEPVMVSPGFSILRLNKIKSMNLSFSH